MRKFISILFILFAHLNAIFAADNNALLGANAFGNPDKYSRFDTSIASPNEKGTILTIDTTASQNVWHKIAELKPAMFQAGKTYTIELKYKITEGGDDMMLFFIVRNLARAKKGEIIDIAQFTPSSTDDKYKAVNLVFQTPEDAKDFSFVIHARGKLKAKVKQLQIFDGYNPANFIRISEDAKPCEDKLENLPTGCAEFEVLLPAPAANAPTVNAADFGVSPKASGADNFKNMQKAIDHCAKVGAAKLVLNKGDYNMFNIETARTIEFRNLKNFEFDGGGSTITFWKKHGGFIDIARCENVKLGNFNLDWNWAEDPIASIAEVVDFGKTDDGKDFADIKFVEYEKFPLRDGVKMSVLCAYDKQKQVRGNGWGMGIETGTNRPTDVKKEWLSDNVLRLTVPKMYNITKGMPMYVQHYYYDSGAFSISDNKHLTLENINVYSCAGHAFLVGGTQQYFQFLNVNIVLRKDVKRPQITCSADHLHFSRSCGFFKMIGCEFSYGVDDCTNFHDCTGFARKHTDNSVLTQNSYGFAKGTKVELRQGDYSPTGFVGTVKETIAIDPSKRVYEVVFEEKLPPQKLDGFIMFDRTYGTRNLLIKDCYFHDTVCRGILLLSSDATIENCRFERHQMGAIKMETGYTFNVWSEGYGVNNVVIRNNKFTDVNIAAHKHGGYARDIFMGVYMKVDPSDVGTMYPILNNILIENNEFNESVGLIAYVSSTGNVTVRDNKFVNRKPTKYDFPYRGSFYVTYSTDTKIINNTWVKSEYVKNAGVMFENSTTKKLKVEGNRIVDDNL